MTDYAFHIHTYRCNHAEIISDEEYIKRALAMGCNSIYFSDHNPFPDNRFTNRMTYEAFSEYCETLNDLKERYKSQISVYIGLETDYLEEYKDFYNELYKSVDFLMLGQHLFSYNNKYNFQLSEDVLQEIEYRYLSYNIIKGLNSKLFYYLAHPDRIFRKRNRWDSDCDDISKKIIDAAVKNNVALEINASVKRNNIYRSNFWNLVSRNCKTIYGIDAHHIKDLVLPLE